MIYHHKLTIYFIIYVYVSVIVNLNYADHIINLNAVTLVYHNKGLAKILISYYNAAIKITINVYYSCIVTDSIVCIYFNPYNIIDTGFKITNKIKIASILL